MRTFSFRAAAKRWDLGPIVAIACLSLALAGGLIWQLRQLVRATTQVDRSDQVVSHTYALARWTLELQTGLRGYVLSGGDPAFLQASASRRQAAFRQLSILSELLSGVPAQQQRVGQLRTRLELWVAHADRVIAAQRAGQEAQSMIAGGEGRRLVEGMGKVVAELVSAEAALRDQRSALAVRRAATTEVVALASLGALGLLLALSLIQRRRSRAELAASEHRFHALTDQLTEHAVYLVDPDGVVASWNEGARRLYGYEPKEILGQRIATFFTPEDVRAGLPTRHREEAAARGQCLGQGWRVRKDGSRFWADQVLTALHGEDGALTGFAKVTRDLSSRKEDQDRLRAAEARLRGVLESAYDPILIADATGEIAFANRQAELALGTEPGALVGSALESLVSPLDDAGRRLLRQRLPAAVSAGRGFALELVARRKDGTDFPISMTLSATGDSGAELRVTAIFRDQTEARRKAARQRLLGELGHELAKAQEYEAVFRLIANLMVPALADWAVVDLCGPDGALSRLVAAHGDPRKQRIADRYLERSTRLKTDREELQRVIRTGQALFWSDHALEELRAAGRDPETLALVEQLGIRALLRVPLKARGRTLGVLTLAASERAFTEEDLHFAEEIAQRGSLVADNARLLEQATREAMLRKDVVAIVSHDLRNPMHAIRLNAHLLEQLLSQHAGGPLPVERLQPIAGAIERAVDRGTRLITDLLDTAQMEARSFSVQRRPASLAGVFQAVLELLVPIAREKGVTLQASSPAQVVPCDPERISQALANLVGNAIKFTPPGGRIELFAEEGPGEVRIAVRDSGRGLSAEVLPHVFERFWQAERGRRTGAGLGLSIVKGIVEAHGGRVWAQSKPGEGSTFWISLPAELPGEVGLRAVGPA